jgi:hypothetical protein
MPAPRQSCRSALAEPRPSGQSVLLVLALEVAKLVPVRGPGSGEAGLEFVIRAARSVCGSE